jgi:carbon catabolite-derepressing protein kinase
VVAAKVLKRVVFEEFGMAFPPREVELLQSLDPHPNLMRLHEVIATANRIVLIQGKDKSWQSNLVFSFSHSFSIEFIPGGELFEYCASKGILHEEEARDLFRQLIQGVHWLHRSGVTHRDLKLENCMLTNDGVLKIIDLGLGTFYRHDLGNSLRTFCGSPDCTEVVFQM